MNAPDVENRASTGPSSTASESEAMTRVIDAVLDSRLAVLESRLTLRLEPLQAKLDATAARLVAVDERASRIETTGQIIMGSSTSPNGCVLSPSCPVIVTLTATSCPVQTTCDAWPRRSCDVVGDTCSRGRRAITGMSVLTAKVASCSSTWTDLVPGTGADVYQEGRAAGCLA